MRYVYSLVQFVPEPANGEFVVIGAIAGSDDSSDWQLRQITNPIRARAIDTRGTLGAVWAFLDRIGQQIDAFERSVDELFDAESPVSEAWLTDLHRRHRNIVQISTPTPIVARSSDEALDLIFEEMVIDPARQRYRFLKKHAALGSVRAAYRRHGVSPGSVQERVTLKTATYSEPFDFAVTNGHVIQLAHTWSFQIPDQADLAEQIKAWGWTIERLREGGGVVSTRLGQQFDVDRDVAIEATYVPAVDDRPSPAFDEAVDVFAACKVRHLSYDGADAIGRRARELIAAGAEHLPL